ncbi:tetratricopeptide repeat protein [Actinoplanes sp. NPDC051861]|uniref:tetratricopeptide repeat protein n=1 Tax=Actinoplanes sp. NPDC051861 TaxID=3155170 RepID=UPI0034282289
MSEPEARVSHSSGVQIGSGNRQVNVGVDAASLPSPQSPRAGSVVHNLPPESKVFVGRDLEELAGRLNGETGVVVGQAAVHGLGGIGKSELVNQYARARLSRHSLVWWITADGPESLGLGLAALTRQLHPVATLADAEAWATGWLQDNSGWLLVLDNVEDVTDITALLGRISGRGQVIVTTRRDLGVAIWAKLGLAPLRLGVLDREASADLLLRLTGHTDRDGADRLAAELGDLPLALEQAAAYIGQHSGTSFDDYRALVTAQFARAAGNAGYGGAADRSVAAVWSVTMDTILSQDALAGLVLDVLSCLAPDDLPDDVLAPLAEEPVDVTDALALLASYSMINWAAGMVSVHRLVQAVTRNAQTADTTAKMQDLAADLLKRAIPPDPISNVSGWPRWTVLLHHVDSVYRGLPEDHESDDMLFVVDRAATYRQHQGQTKRAVEDFERVLSDLQRLLGADHPTTLTARNNLAYAYQSAGRVEAAVEELEKLVADQRRVLPADELNALVSRSNLAFAYRSAGRIDAAIDVCEKALADIRRLLGEDHRFTLLSRNNVADLYTLVGRVDEAIDEFERILADRRRVLGEDHPDTLVSRINLASAYQAAGRIEAATDECEKALTDSRRVLGEEHPDTLTVRNNLAGAYLWQGRTDEAIAEYRTVLVQRRRVLGDDHPDTFASWRNVAYACQAAGRVTEAIDEYERALTEAVPVLGPAHKTVLDMRTSLDDLRHTTQP